MDKFPPGFRFYPTEEELVSFYLRRKLQGNSQALDRVIPVLDIYELEPSELPRKSGELCQGDTEQWFFFVPMHQRESRGGRPNRTTATGYWKATGSPSYVYSSTDKVIGVNKTMVYYNGKAPLGRKTRWKMNEYKAIEEQVITNLTTNATPATAAPRLRHELSVCRVYVVSGTFRAFDRRPLGTEITETADAKTSSSLEHSDSGNKETNGDDMMIENEENSSIDMLLESWDWHCL